MSNDGLSTDEKVNLLFKNYMNFTSTLDSKAFFEETALANNTNIFSDNILSSTPSTNPTFGDAITSAATLSSLLETGMPDISINDTWLNTKTGDGGTFQEDASSTILRLNRIKLDYVTNGGASFICKDNEGNNILQNLIPSNYAANGYSLSLEYKDGSSIKSVPWLAPRGNTGTNGSLSKILGTNVNFGGALFDAKNGVVTFYDVNGDPNSVFSSAEFYLSATKYIGPKGAAASGSGGGTDEAAVKALIDASLNAHYYTQTYIDGSLNAVRSYTDTKVADLVHSAPATLDTLNELAAALGDDPNYATTISSRLGVVDTSINVLETDVASNGSAITTLQGRTDINDTSINALESDVATNTSAIATNFSNIANNTSNISTNASNITTLQGRVDINDISINTLESGVAANQISINNNASDITTNANNISTLQGRVDINDISINALESGVAANQISINNNASDITTNASNITTLQGRVDINDISINTLESTTATNATNITANAGAITTLQGRTDINDASINALETDVATNAGGIATNVTNITTLQGRTDINDASINYIEINYSTINYVDTKVADLVDSAPATLDTLNELAAALGDDPNYATTISSRLGVVDTSINNLRTNISDVAVSQVAAQLQEFTNPFNYQTDFTTFDSEDFGLLQENENPYDYPISFDSDITTFDNQDFAISRPNEFAASVGDLSINQLRTNQLFLAGELRQF